MHLSKQVFRSQELQKYLSYKAHLCFKMFKINVDSKNAIKKLKKNSVNFFQIIAFQLLVVNSPHYYENTGSWQSTC